MSTVVTDNIEVEERWTEVILPQTSLFDLRLKELWRYRDLLRMFVRRDFIATYKQTLLGPLWFLIQPILTTITYMVIFGGIANIGTDGIPQPVFYMSGITIWNYFAECLNKNATVFVSNASIFGKVYFPRLIMPLSIVISSLIKLGIQFFLFICVWSYFKYQGAPIYIQWQVMLLPLYVLLSGLIALGLGMIISSLTTKYRDFIQLLSFAIQLGMYATPVIYPLSKLSGTLRHLIWYNPLTHIVEGFRYSFTGMGEFSWAGLGYTTAFAFIVLFIGVLIFNQVQKRFMDTV